MGRCSTLHGFSRRGSGAAMRKPPVPGVGTNLRSFRIPQDEWVAALAVARSRGESLSGVLRVALREYVARGVSK